MKSKLIAIVMGLALLTSPAYARSIAIMHVQATGSTTINAYATGSTVYTTAMAVDDAANYALSFNATATALRSPNITVTLEQASQLPAVEAQSDPYWATVNTTVLANAFTTNSLNWTHQIITMAPMPYARFKIVGNTGNSTDTTVKMNLLKQYDV